MNDKKYSILIVDDDLTNVEVLSEILESEYELYIAEDGADAIEIASKFLPDVILLDIILPEMDGYEVITTLKRYERTRNIPVIFVTELNNEADERKGLMLGASDYIGKPFSSAIVELRVRNQIAIIEQLRTIEKLSMTDTLTGLPNRRSFDTRFKSDWGRAQRERIPMSILVVDIDNFKKYNDTNGHQQGDVALQALAEKLTESLKRSGDFVARWGGEEFIVLLPNTNSKGSRVLAERIRKNAEDMIIPCLEDGAGEKITVSIGATTKEYEDKITTTEFFSRADEALYKAKNDGRNRAIHFNDLAAE